MFIKLDTQNSLEDKQFSDIDKPMDLSIASKSADSSLNEGESGEDVETTVAKRASNLDTPVAVKREVQQVTPPSPPKKRSYDEMASASSTPKLSFTNGTATSEIEPLLKRPKLYGSTSPESSYSNEHKFSDIKSPQISVKSFSRISPEKECHRNPLIAESNNHIREQMEKAQLLAIKDHQDSVSREFNENLIRNLRSMYNKEQAPDTRQLHEFIGTRDKTKYPQIGHQQYPTSKSQDNNSSRSIESAENFRAFLATMSNCPEVETPRKEEYSAQLVNLIKVMQVNTCQAIIHFAHTDIYFNCINE